MLRDFLDQTFLNNRLWDYLNFLVVLLFGSIMIKVLKMYIFKHLKIWSEKTTTKIDNFLVNTLDKKLFPFLYLALLYFGLNGLKLNPFIKRGLNILGITLITFYSVRLALDTLSYVMEFIWTKKEVDASRKGALNGIVFVFKVLVWCLATIIFLDNLGVKISGLITGLGIGGVAVALAAQAVLGDLFSYFTIFFDRPFEIGDFVNIGDFSGTVEFIGVKTTRLRSLSGEQLIFPNSDLTNSRVRNYKRMERRRVVFKIGVAYQTSTATLKAIPQIIENIITGFEDTIFDRAHFVSYGDYSLVFEIVYYVIGSDYKRYMDIQQEINLQIKTEFEQRGIKFAYPTQILYLEQNFEPQL
ncbi:MAG TPA: mechanosensitive ion channel domain-containing protein [Bacillota bacterium]